MTEQEAESILEQIGSTGGGDHAEEGISFATVLELLAGLRSAPAGQGAAATPPGDFITQVAGIEEALYELHLRLWNLTKDNLYRDASPAQKMAGMLTEHMDMQLLEVYRRAAEMRKHLA